MCARVLTCVRLLRVRVRDPVCVGVCVRVRVLVCCVVGAGARWGLEDE